MKLMRINSEFRLGSVTYSVRISYPPRFPVAVTSHAIPPLSRAARTE